MKFLLLICLIFGLIFLNRAATMRGTYEDPNHPGKCVVGDIILSPGERISTPHPKCRRIMCGDNSMVLIHTCGAVLPPEGYKLGDRVDPTAQIALIILQLLFQYEGSECGKR